MPFLLFVWSTWEHRNTMNDEDRRALRDKLGTAKDEKMIREILRLAESFYPLNYRRG
jgi:hypothetical protein